jgi:hypothetical protein
LRGGTVFFVAQGARRKKYRSGGLARGRREDDFLRIDAVNPLNHKEKCGGGSNGPLFEEKAPTQQDFGEYQGVRVASHQKSRRCAALLRNFFGVSPL